MKCSGRPSGSPGQRQAPAHVPENLELCNIVPQRDKSMLSFADCSTNRRRCISTGQRLSPQNGAPRLRRTRSDRESDVVNFLCDDESGLLGDVMSGRGALRASHGLWPDCPGLSTYLSRPVSTSPLGALACTPSAAGGGCGLRCGLSGCDSMLREGAAWRLSFTTLGARRARSMETAPNGAGSDSFSARTCCMASATGSIHCGQAVAALQSCP